MIDVCRWNKCGFLDRSGKAAIALRFKNVEPFSEGLAAASLDGRRYGFIDHSGKFIIAPRYDGLGPTRNISPPGPSKQVSRLRDARAVGATSTERALG